MTESLEQRIKKEIIHDLDSSPSITKRIPSLINVLIVNTENPQAYYGVCDTFTSNIDKVPTLVGKVQLINAVKKEYQLVELNEDKENEYMWANFCLGSLNLKEIGIFNDSYKENKQSYTREPANYNQFVQSIKTLIFKGRESFTNAKNTAIAIKENGKVSKDVSYILMFSDVKQGNLCFEEKELNSKRIQYLEGLINKKIDGKLMTKDVIKLQVDGVNQDIKDIIDKAKTHYKNAFDSVLDVYNKYDISESIYKEADNAIEKIKDRVKYIPDVELHKGFGDSLKSIIQGKDYSEIENHLKNLYHFYHEATRIDGEYFNSEMGHLSMEMDLSLGDLCQEYHLDYEGVGNEKDYNRMMELHYYRAHRTASRLLELSDTEEPIKDRAKQIIYDIIEKTGNKNFLADAENKFVFDKEKKRFY